MKPAESPSPIEPPHKKRLVTVLFQLFLSIAVLGCGAALAAYLLKTGPEVKPRKREPTPPLVQVIPLKARSERLVITGMGTVLAAKELNLTSRVGGEVNEISENLVPGGFFAKNEPILAIEPIDFELTILQLQSEVANARSELDLEMGSQRIASRELELLGQQVTDQEKKLMLRQPQLEMKKAALQGAEAKLARAELDLRRTEVVAPFNAVVQSRSVTIGTRVSESTPLARLIGTDEFWLKLTIPVDQLKWLTIPVDGSQSGSTIKIIQDAAGTGEMRTGNIIRLAADLEDQGRMAIVYAAVQDPLCLLPENRDKPKLLLGSFVRAEIEGAELSSVIPIDRSHLREGQTVWLLGDDGTLEIRAVEIAAKNRNTVFIEKGVKEGEMLIVTNLSAPLAGTPMKIMGEEGQSDKQDKAPTPAGGPGNTHEADR